MRYCHICETPQGWIGFSFTAGGIYALTFPAATPQAAREDLGREAGAETEPNEAMRRLAQELARYFAGEPVKFTCPVDWSGYTPFQRDVLQYTHAIPYGRTCSYGDIARAVGRPQAARAVGQALHINRTPVVVPCHRVISGDGRLGGFGGGLAMKRTLLALERVTVPE